MEEQRSNKFILNCVSLVFEKMTFLSVKKLECGRCCLRGENKYFYLVSLLEIGPIRLFAFEAGPIKLLVCMSSSGYLFEDIFFVKEAKVP